MFGSSEMGDEKRKNKNHFVDFLESEKWAEIRQRVERICDENKKLLDEVDE